MRVLTLVLAAFMVVGLVGFPGQAHAQNTPLVLDNYMAWWDHLSCQRMINAVNAVTNLDTAHPVLAGEDEVYSSTPNNSTREWCVLWADLGQNQQRAMRAAAMQARADGGITTKASDRVFDKTAWWDGMTVEGRRIAIGGVIADISDAPEQSGWSALTVSLADRATAAYMALMGDTAMKPTPTPAVPLVGLGVLGLLLAGRGAYLRRRTR